jgi:hypothetical protein
MQAGWNRRHTDPGVVEELLAGRSRRRSDGVDRFAQRICLHDLHRDDPRQQQPGCRAVPLVHAPF